MAPGGLLGPPRGPRGPWVPRALGPGGCRQAADFWGGAGGRSPPAHSNVVSLGKQLASQFPIVASEIFATAPFHFLRSPTSGSGSGVKKNYTSVDPKY